MGEERSAWETALKWLQRADRSESEVTLYLQKKEFKEEEIQSTIARLYDYKYLSDHNLKSRVEETHKKQLDGPLKIQQKLSQRGLDQEITYPPGIQQALKLLQKKFPSIRATEDPKEFARAARFLANKGYTEDDINSALESFFTQYGW